MTPRIRLTEHFYLHEFTRSQTAERHGINNMPTAEHLKNIVALCEDVLEPMRAHFGAVVLVSSGYRSRKVNRKVGGSKTSQHCFGEAADFTVVGKTVDEVFNWLAFESGIEYNQVIHEFGSWVHVGYRRGGPNKRQALLARKRRIRGRMRTTYTETTRPV